MRERNNLVQQLPYKLTGHIRSDEEGLNCQAVMPVTVAPNGLSDARSISQSHLVRPSLWAASAQNLIYDNGSGWQQRHMPHAQRSCNCTSHVDPLPLARSCAFFGA
jgi:hypothetical protein